MFVACRDMTLNGQPVVAGQVLDGIWPGLRARTQTALLRTRYVEDVAAVEDAKLAGTTVRHGPDYLAFPSEQASSSQAVAPQTVHEAPQEFVVEITPPKRKRGRPKGSKNKPKPVAPA